ncbi:MAG: MXAN_2562 family outer membrane beta-barrel protein [Kofleriaceae bacterium]
MIKYVASLVAVVLASSVAYADDTGMLPNTAVLSWNRVKIRENVVDGGDLTEPEDSDTFRQRLNAAACECSRQNVGDTDLYYELQVMPETNSGRGADLFVGTECQDNIQRPMTCRKLGSIADIDDLFSPDDVSFRLYDIINPTADGTTACREEESTANVWVTFDGDGDTVPDFFSPRPLDLAIFTDVTGFDTLPPPQLANLRAQGGEDSIQIEWDAPTSREEDFYQYQAFCSTVEGIAPVTGITPVYSTVATVCGLAAPELALTPAIVDPLTGDAADVDVTLPREFATLDSGFLCGTQDQATATSMTISGLENNVQYKVAIVAIDFYGNPSGAFFTRTITPKPVTDFWEDLHERGSGVEGGFCSSSGSAGSLVIVLGVLGLVCMRRRRGLAIVAVGLLAVMPRVASADDYTPYWDDQSSADDAAANDAGPKWQAGIKLGPYTPAIDAQAGKNAASGMGPYQAMFGNYFIDGAPNDSHVYQILPMLDVDRFIWTGSGQLGIGGTLGYMQKSAYPYVEGTSPDDPRRPRSTAGRNTFRLIPFALTVTYRATQLDDLYGIPLVPYVRGGLSYYVWWLKGPNGDVAKVCKDGSMDTENCDANKAYGGSLGLQGSIGLAIRAERIDSDAARSMLNSGIYHAGFYAELMYASVDGFGSDKKLSVGDKTWFAGVNFEF